LITGVLTEGHARAILALEDVDKMIAFADYIIQNNLSVREAENEVKKFLEKEKYVSRETSEKKEDFILKNAEDELIRTFGTKVEIKGNRKRGRIEIHYFSDEDFTRLLEIFRKLM